MSSIKLSTVVRRSSSSLPRLFARRCFPKALLASSSSSSSAVVSSGGAASSSRRYFGRSSIHHPKSSIKNATSLSRASSAASSTAAVLSQDDKAVTLDASQTRSSSSETTTATSSLPASPPTSPSSTASTTPPFRKILIANRGEIAVRIIQSARLHGIQSVAIYSTADARSPHVSLADEAVCIGPPASGASYLDADRVCAAVELTGAEGVHPGYGFLSENGGFAERVEGMFVNEAPHGGDDDGSSNGNGDRKKVRFIGPNAHAIQSLGDKIQSKLIAEEAGVSTIPGYNGVVASPDHAVEIANDIGYPVMIKASSGGGGKGMRICYDDDAVVEGYRLGSAEAKSFFGDDRLLVEKYVEDPHHIEIQVLSGRNPANDGELDVLCFPERECSVQRRNQKVIEESPSPHLLPATRRDMIRQVKSLVRKVGYESAGTVEFLVDENQNFYFLEMNTRLQVEHPVTEMISGDGYASGNYVDLVYGMLEIAAGRGVPQRYLDMVDRSDDEEAGDGGEGANVRYTGHAIEARVYAEDPLRGFLPSTGPLVKYVEPPSVLEVDDGEGGGRRASRCHIRIDTGVVPGAIITPHYDPILSKVISYSESSRAHAINGLGAALDRYLLKGVRHNVPFVRDVLRNEDFARGYTPTGFIGEHYPDGFSGGRLSGGERREMAAIAREIQRRREAVLDNPPLAFVGDGKAQEEEEGVVVCLGGMFGDAYLVRSEVIGDVVTSAVTNLPKRGRSKDADENNDDSDDMTESETETFAVQVSGLDYEPSGDFAHVEIDGESRALQVHGDDEIGTLKLTMYGSDADILVMSPDEYHLACHMNEPKEVDLGDFVLSPMPGTLISFAVKEGDIVELGQELCVVEAMKMQNVIRAHKAGATVGKLHGEVGASLRADEILLEFEKEVEEEDEEEAA